MSIDQLSADQPLPAADAPNPVNTASPKQPRPAHAAETQNLAGYARVASIPFLFDTVVTAHVHPDVPGSMWLAFPSGHVARCDLVALAAHAVADTPIRMWADLEIAAPILWPDGAGPDGSTEAAQ